MKVAVVSNRKKEGVINRFGTPCPERCGKKTIQGVIDGLCESGHTVMFAEADLTLTETLMEFMPPHDETFEPSGIVFNMAYGIQGSARYTHLPAMLEMTGVPYTGSDPFGHALALDKVTTKIILQSAGIPTPNFKVFGHLINFVLKFFCFNASLERNSVEFLSNFGNFVLDVNRLLLSVFF